MMLMMVLIQRKFVYSLIDFYNKKLYMIVLHTIVLRQGDREREGRREGGVEGEREGGRER